MAGDADAGEEGTLGYKEPIPPHRNPPNQNVEKKINRDAKSREGQDPAGK